MTAGSLAARASKDMAATRRRKQERQEIAKIKRGVCKRLREMIAPLTWRSAYHGRSLFDFADAGMADAYKVRGAVTPRYADDGVEALCQDGIAFLDDTVGKLCVLDFERTAVEDLVLLESLLRKLLPRMQAGSKAFRDQIAAKARAAAEKAMDAVDTVDGHCAECGESMRLDTVSGVSTHTTQDGGVDYDRDADHVPRLDREYGEA